MSDLEILRYIEKPSAVRSAEILEAAGLRCSVGELVVARHYPLFPAIISWRLQTSSLVSHEFPELPQAHIRFFYRHTTEESTGG
ncbi:hypothetical protein I7I48_11972 [Histoplasma ohiense]|nr:hypothetical protein I7I48_11972 [Histoplasma ohiense (nom. inval.)]